MRLSILHEMRIVSVLGVWVFRSVEWKRRKKKRNHTQHLLQNRTKWNTKHTKHTSTRKNYLWIWRKKEYEKQIPTHVLAFIRIIWHTLYSSPLAPSVGFSHSLCKCVIIWLCCCYVISDICYMILWNCACIHILTYSPNLLCVCTVYTVHATSFHPISIKKSYLFLAALSFYLANKNEK